MPTLNLGHVRFVPRGEYVNEETYTYLSVVFYEGTSYFCKVPVVSGVTPTDEGASQYWQMLIDRLPITESEVESDTGTQTVKDALNARVEKGQVGNEEVTTSTGTQTVSEALDQRGPVFDNVADMQAATNISLGIKVRTLGYYSPGDGGGNDYEVVAAGTGTEDGGSFIDLGGSGLQAKGLFPNKIHVEQFGADSGSDSKDNVEKCSIFAASHESSVFYQSRNVRLDRSIKLPGNVSWVVNNNAVVDFSRQTVGSYSAGAFGDFSGSETPIATNMTSGDSVVTTTVPHGLSAGDYVLVKSQRACSVPEDAGDWTLGETTANTSSPFFAECKQVLSVVSPTEFEISTELIFPDYRTDDSQETYVDARPSTTVEKINFKEDVKILGGVWVGAVSGISLFRLYACLEPVVNVEEVRLHNAPGSAIFSDSVLRGNFKAKASRPSGWEIVRGHSAYNTFKDVGCWECDWDLVDIRGCQGWDQSFFNGRHPSLFPKLKMKAIDNLEDGSTTHGNSYGAIIEIHAIRPRITGYRGRSPYSSVDVVMDGPGKDRVNSGMSLSTYGVRYCSYGLTVRNCDYSIDIKEAGVTQDTPADFNSVIYRLHQYNVRIQGIFIRDRTDNNTLPANLFVSNIVSSNCRSLLNVGAYNHGVHISGGVVIGGPLSSGLGHIEYQANSMGNSISNIKSANFADPTSSLIYTRSNVDSNLKSIYPFGVDVDWDSVKHTGTGSLGDPIGFDRTTFQNYSVFDYTVSSKDSGNHIYITTGGDATLNLTNGIPIGSFIKITMKGSGTITLVAGSGVSTIESAKGLVLSGEGATAFARRTGGTAYTVSGDLQASI